MAQGKNYRRMVEAKRATQAGDYEKAIGILKIVTGEHKPKAQSAMRKLEARLTPAPADDLCSE